MKICIIGAGPAGCAAAYYLGNQGYSVDIFEEKSLGGACKTNFYKSIPYEFGPQILYTELDDIRTDFEKFVSSKTPPSEDGEYHPKVSIDGEIDNCHDFPLTLANVQRLPNSDEVINELYHLNLNSPDYSSLENYLLSRVGKTLYETYMKNYNIKQWKISPEDMDAQWASTRTLTLRKKPDMFRGKWQGHPGDYTPLWEGLTQNANILYEKAEIVHDNDGFVYDYRVNGESLRDKYDVLVSTTSPNNKLPSINFTIIYVGVKSKDFVMPSYATSFPNNYDFVRILEYKQQFFVDSGYSLLDFEFPWTEKSGYHLEDWKIQVREFCKSKLKLEIQDIFVQNSYRTYPLITKQSLSILDETFSKLSHTNIIPIGRAGIHSYISKDTCMYMAKCMATHISDYPSYSPSQRISFFRKLRERLS
jgi:UDP-galactopyranose mutase